MDRTSALAARRTAEMAAMFMIGNGLLGLLQPERRIALWTSDHPLVDRFVAADRARSAAARRNAALLQIGAGLVASVLIGLT
jgi:hypothetical protein